MDVNDAPGVPVETQLEEVSDAIQRAAGDLLAARLVLDRERAEFAAKAGTPSRELLLAATRVVDEMRRTDEALTDLLKQLEVQSASR
jgi:DNA-binding FadR family transcriptional regulator